MHNYNACPNELKVLQQWIVWRAELNSETKKTIKRPISPHTARYCDVNDKQSYSTFDHCVWLAENYPDQVTGIGFCLTADDPYCFIDFDQTDNESNFELQKAIFTHTKSYAELSPSGNGLHIVAKANLPSGRKRFACEIYTSGRFMTMTGIVYRDAEIIEEQEVCTQVWEKLAKPIDAEKLNKHNGGDQQQSDEEIINAGCNAANGEKFHDLGSGNWQKHYSTQSEADFALMNMLAYYSKNKDQIVRLFHSSALGQRDKAKRKDYLKWMLDRVFDNDAPEIDITELRNKIKAQVESEPEPEPETEPEQSLPTKTNSSPLPPGLVGEIANFIYQRSAMPIPEVALSSAFALMAGICGRSYNVNGDGLNMYVLCMARTGRGKSMGSKCVNILMSEVERTTRDAMTFIGPKNFTSGSSLNKELMQNNSFVSYFGEFGFRMKQMVSPRASSAEVSLNAEMLDLYARSGKGDISGKTSYSAKENTIQKVLSPAFSLWAESNPDTFYECIDEGVITQGLLPRFWVLESFIERLRKNENAHLHKPDPYFISRIKDVICGSMMMNSRNAICEVQLSDDAKKLLYEYEGKCNDKINNSKSVAYQNLWTRAEQQAVKLASLIAVGVNHTMPMVQANHLQWAINEVDKSIANICKRVRTGDIASINTEHVQLENLRDLLQEYVNSKFKDLRKYKGVDSPAMHADRIIPWPYIYDRARRLAAFKRDRYGPAKAIESSIATLLKLGEIGEIKAFQIKEQYFKSYRAYTLLN